MFKKTMTFDDLEGNEVTQTFYFNYNKKEIGELLEFGYVADFRPDDNRRRLPLEDQLTALSTPVEKSGLNQIENNEQAYAIFQDLILNAYGEKGADNVTFVKNERTREYFKSHVAYVEMVFEFLGNSKLATEFLENCLPPKQVAKAKAELENSKIPAGSLADMVAEAERRQSDPATRIEPGTPPVGSDPEVEKVAAAVASSEPEAQKPEDMTPEDIRQMGDAEFQRIDVRRLSKDAMFAAFERKNKG